MIGQGGRLVGKGTCIDYDVIITSEFKLKDSGGVRECGALGLKSSTGPLVDTS